VSLPRLVAGSRRALIAAAIVGACSAGCAVESNQKTPLTQLYTPTFPAPPPAESAWTSLRKLSSQVRTPVPPNARSPLLPNQSGVLWLALLVAVSAGFDFRNPRNPRNVDLLIMQAIGWCFYDILTPLDHLTNPTERNLMDWTFTAIVVLTLALMVRALRRISRPARAAWAPEGGARTLAVVALGFVLLDVGVALYSPPDDAGYFINIGAQRFRERLRWPYGDPLLTGTPAAAYGPVLYAAHLPFQLLLAPAPVNPESPPRPLIEQGQLYFLPPLAATKLCTIAFHLLGVGALLLAVRRLSGSRAAWALVALYCSSAFVLGVGGAVYSIGGITFTSHIAPAAITLLAFALLGAPAWSGAALAAAIGALFYPIFMVPAWLGYYWGRRGDLRRFLVGFVIVSAVIGGSVLLQSRAANGRSRIGTILYDTIGHQESPEAYGSSPFGFWGQRTGLRGWLMTPLVSGQSMTRPVVLAFFVFAAAMFRVAQHRTPAQFALVVAAVAMGAQLWKIHATATYVTWYYPFLLIGLLCDPGVRGDAHV
jgi:hypothetical protein